MGRVGLPQFTGPEWLRVPVGKEVRESILFRRGQGGHDILMSEVEGIRMPDTATATSVYDFSAPLLNGRTLKLSAFKGNVMLIVNTASQCGFTLQYAGLETLYRAYENRGFIVLAFPCNQFGAQEPGSAEEIGAFCRNNYGVSFPIFDRIDVNGPETHPLYQFLKQSQPGSLSVFTRGAIKWNFTKFLVDRNGNVVARYASTTQPEKLKEPIEQLLTAG
jgi:glutathione peroxidase